MKKIIEFLVALVAVVTLAGCASLAGKAVGAAGAVDALKIESSGSTSTGTPTPNIIAGGAVSAVATSPSMEDGKTAAPVFSYARRSSFFGSLFGLDCDTIAAVYIGSPGETAADTAARMNAISAAIDKSNKDTPAAAEEAAPDTSE